MTADYFHYKGPPETQFQCDLNTAPVAGFTIGSNLTLSYNSSDKFYACPATDTEYNIYITPNFGQTKCIPITLMASGCGNGNPTGCSSAAPSTSTYTLTTISTIWQTVTSTITANCFTSTPPTWSNSSSSSSTIWSNYSTAVSATKNASLSL